MNKTDKTLCSQEIDKERSRGNFLRGGNILYLGKGLGYTGVCVCQNLNDMLQMYVSLYVNFAAKKITKGLCVNTEF